MQITKQIINMSQNTEPFIVIDCNKQSNIPKINFDEIGFDENYKLHLELLQRHHKSLNNTVKKIAFNFRAILFCILNEDKLKSLEYLNAGLKHAYKFYMPEFRRFVAWHENSVLQNDSVTDLNYDTISDIARMVLQQIAFKDRLEEVNKILMGYQ